MKSKIFCRLASLVFFCFYFSQFVVALTYTVINQNDSAAGSLRKAIQNANTNPGYDYIVFSIPATGVQTIILSSPLPPLSDPNGVSINGYSQPGAQANTQPQGTPSDANLLIELSGQLITWADGLYLSAGPNFIQGLVINRFSRGIVIDGTLDGGVGNYILGCYIGTDPSGNLPRPNLVAGIEIFNAPATATNSGTHIGGRCLISGNANGIIITGPGTTNHCIYGNFIGTKVSGLAALGNTNAGVMLRLGASGNLIGGQADVNIISGNLYGVLVTDPGTCFNYIRGNYIGTNVNGNGIVSNTRSGVRILNGATYNSVGYYTPSVQFCNLISGNGYEADYSGIDILGAGTNYNSAEGNYIGTDWSGNFALPNAGSGICIFNGASNNEVGGDYLMNVVSGNLENGIWITGQSTSYNKVVRSLIGLNGTGLVSLPNQWNGILVDDKASSTEIGGTVAGDYPNYISGNLLNGIRISDLSTDHTLIRNNYIGLNINLSALPNGNNGVLICNNSMNTTIGGLNTYEENTIAFNGGHGILIDNAHHNWIGSQGISYLWGRNIIRNNTGCGIAITGAGADNNIITRNSIFSNGGPGIDLGNNGVTVNDNLDPDTGPNQETNYPVIQTATWSYGFPNSTTYIAGYIQIDTNPLFANVELFSVGTADPTGYGEGDNYVASFTPDASGNWGGTVSGLIGVGSILTATTTDMNGNTSEFSQTFTIQAFDFGDAPPPYPTKLVNNGASHSINWNVRMGNSLDNETDGLPDSYATGDDALNDDEDGVEFLSNLVPGTLANVRVTASIAGKLNAWVDFNKDGDWADPGEKVFTDASLVAGINLLIINIPVGALSGLTFARFRFNTQGGLSYTGPASDGEVEDYQVLISQGAFSNQDFGDAPEGTVAYPSLNINGAFPTCKTAGAAGWIQHTYSGAWFGYRVDFESDGNASLCPFAPNNPYDQDECYNDGDAGLIRPSSFTINGNPSNPTVAGCAGSSPIPLGYACSNGTSMAFWGPNIDILVQNIMPNPAPAYVNLLVDWNQDGQWSGASPPCPGMGSLSTPEHVLKDFIIPPNFSGPLSLLNPNAFNIGPNSGYFWIRFSITNLPVLTPWDGSGSFNGGETEDYLIQVLPAPIPDSLLVQNSTVPPGFTNCFEAIQKITVAGNGTYFTVMNGGNVHFIAGQKILFLTGTTVQSGGNLHAYITTNGVYCSNPLKLVEGQTIDDMDDIKEIIPGFKVFPNPTTGTLTIELAHKTEVASTVIEIYSMMGEKLIRKELPAQTKYEISLTTQPRGMYILRVISGKETRTVKVIKQ
jgi:hypothetical protein